MVKKSSVSATPHLVTVDPGHIARNGDYGWHPIIYYSNPDGTASTDYDRRFIEFYSVLMRLIMLLNKVTMCGQMDNPYD